MTYSVKGPFRGNENGTIDCYVKYDEGHPLSGEGWMPFTAHPTEGKDGPEIHKKLLEKHGPKITFPEPKSDAELRDREARARRAKLLRETDWTQLPDVPQATREIWADYRQALRDLTTQKTWPTKIRWPKVPEV